MRRKNPRLHDRVEACLFVQPDGDKQRDHQGKNHNARRIYDRIAQRAVKVFAGQNLLEIVQPDKLAFVLIEQVVLV